MEFHLKKKLTRRERYAVYAAGIAVLVFLLLQFIAFPLVENRKRLEKSLAIKTKTLQEMQRLKSEYEALNGQSAFSGIDFSQREKGFTLFSFLDKLSGQAGIKDHITYMKPSDTGGETGEYKLSQVELKIKALNLKQLATYLYMIETSKNRVFVKRLSLTQSSNPDGFIDVVLQVETYET
jgi:general secretion pathway protein M